MFVNIGLIVFFFFPLTIMIHSSLVRSLGQYFALCARDAALLEQLVPHYGNGERRGEGVLRRQTERGRDDVQGG
jgi:hypothetical protein